MASIKKRGESYWVQIRRAGQPEISKTFKKKALAKEWAAATEAALQTDLYRAEKTKIGDVIRDSQKTLVLPYQKERQYEYINENFGHLQLQELTADVLIEYARKRFEDVEPATIKVMFAYIHTLLKYAENKMGLKPNMSDYLRAKEMLKDARIIDSGDSRDRRVSDQEMALISSKQNLHSNRDAKFNFSLKDMMRFAVLTAMRRGEQFGLTWKELDVDDRTVGVWRKHPKGKKYSRVPLLAEAMDIILAQPRGTEKIFPVTDVWAAETFRDCRDAAGIEDLTWHDMRHEGCSRLHELGLDSMTVSLFSGHRNIQMLMRYTHLNPSRVVENLRGLNL